MFQFTKDATECVFFKSAEGIFSLFASKLTGATGAIPVKYSDREEEYSFDYDFDCSLPIDGKGSTLELSYGAYVNGVFYEHETRIVSYSVRGPSGVLLFKNHSVLFSSTSVVVKQFSSEEEVKEAKKVADAMASRLAELGYNVAK